MSKIGILAYGSLRNDPGSEIIAVLRGTINNVETPFNVEFARVSKRRANAPTLVPVDDGGSPQLGVLLVLDCDLQTAMDMLWRRETNQVESEIVYKRPKEPTENTVLVESHADRAGVSHALYTRIAATIPIVDRTPQHLARLAIQSAETLKNGRDGISYLRNAINHGTSTPLTRSYKTQILDTVGVSTLEAALRHFGIAHS